MKNLTSNQQNIIDSLVNEFTKMNAPTKVGSGLINVSQIISDYDVKQKAIQEVKLNNSRFKQMAIDMCQKEFDIIKDDIQSLGIKIEIDPENKRSIIIGTKEYNVKLGYSDNTRYDELTRMHVIFEVQRKSYLRANHLENFASLEQWTSDSRFNVAVKRIYEDAQAIKLAMAKKLGVRI